MSQIRRIAVLGAGNGGCAAAATLTLRGFEVRLQARRPDRATELVGGITIAGGATANPALIDTDLGRVIEGADLVMLTVPANAHADYARQLAPRLAPSSLVLLNPGHTGGSLNFATAWRGAGGGVLKLAETATLTWICRLQSAATVAIFRETAKLRFAAFPTQDTDEWVAQLQPLFSQLEAAGSVLETGLININAVLHVAGTLMNAGWIEHTGGDFLYYREGFTPAIARVVEAVDSERLAVAAALGVTLPAFVDVFFEAGLTSIEARASGSVARALADSLPNRSIKAPGSLNHRYLHEDVGFGLVPMAEFGRLTGTLTPAIDSLITLAGVANGIDYRRAGANLNALGLAGLSVAGVRNLLQHGFSA